MKPIYTSGTNFEKIIKEGCVYVDKTESLYNLISSPENYYFLSRPRRFGKSMTLQTFKAIFKGKKELFKDLYIGKETDYDFKKFPVLYIDFGKCDYHRAAKVKEWIKKQIVALLDNNTPIEKDASVSDCLSVLFSSLSKKNKTLVILIDEYDRPIVDNIDDEKECEAIKRVLKDFYTVLKANSEYLRFVFITGVSKFAKVGVFSGMNNLLNISLNRKYASIVGFTKEEVLTNFADYIEKGIKDLGVTREEYLSLIKAHYDGYHFSLESDESVYNPVSIGLFFTEGEGVNFKNYWIETGTTELLMKMAKENDFSILTDTEMKIDFDSVSEYDVAALINNPTSEAILYFMYQTGYLTLKGKDEDGFCILDFPNNEVRSSFLKKLVKEYLSDKGLSPTLLTTIVRKLRTGEKEEAFKDINALYASLSYKSFNKYSTEKDFLNPLVFALKGSIGKGEFSLDEYPVSSGLIDYILYFKNYIYILEAKLNKSNKEALDSIIERGYYKQFLSSNEKREIILVGLNFNYDKSNQSKMRLLDDPEFLVLDK